MIRDLNIYGTVTRTLSIAARGYTVNETELRFMAQLDLPRGAGPSSDRSPRDGSPFTMRFRTGSLGLAPGSVRAGHRVTLIRAINPGRVFNGEYEVIEDPKVLRVGRIEEGMEAHVLPVGLLYPFSSTLKDQDGTEVADVNIALWTNSETHQDTGLYEDFSGEAAIEYASEIKSNRSLWIGSERYRITSSVTDFAVPRVRFEARRSNG